MQRRELILAAVAALPWAAQAQTQSWPTKPIRLIVPFPPGGTTDVVTRLVAAELTKALGQSVVVDNKPGAGTVLGVDLAAKSPPDGHTLVTVANSFCVNQTLVKNLPYDGLRDLRPVGLMGMSEHVLATHPGSGLKTVADLIAAAKKQPGKLSYASFGAGTSAHIAGAMLEAQAGIEMIHAPYKGQAPALNDLIGGQVTVMFGNWPEFRQHVQSGKLVALGMATAKRSPLAPQIATLTEQGLPIESNSWNGILTRSGTPDAVVQRLNAEINKALQTPTVVQAFQEGGIVSLAASPERFAAFIRSETDKYAQVIRKAGITAES
ncbi:tripartite tricarboxylate transporter substrate binding protein [Limnohabitans sp. Jir72]|uniref:tripartite tricarboxylate transporter substrate binding protein n=1 Tax=Limnohabitans sp. Jir72 TaxID=1977909 RepID=UPI000D3C6947|nr:tripartite tricarboxylate transporter substrate binding protein [Limnohabitans sp. Jir72]PUE31865.1 LacI family transcriptional regulator [Limnohabitans sp. Jir72]